MAATATILELHVQPRPPGVAATRFAQVLLADGGVQRVMGVGAIPLAGDAQAYLDARADALFARAATEGTAYDAAAATADLDDAKRLYDRLDLHARALRSVVLVSLDEINTLRSWITSFKVEVAAASSLADLKTRVAGLPNTPARTAAQARTALRNHLDAGA